MNYRDILAELADLRRRLDNTVRLGVVVAADYAVARVRVNVGGLTSDWVPWLSNRAGNDRAWHAPEVGEQVLMLSPSGDLNQGVAMPGIFYNQHPANADRATVHRTTYADGAVVEYDREAHRLTVNIPGSVVLTTTGNVTATIGGNLDATVSGSASATVSGTTSVTSTGAVSLTSSASIALNAPTIGLNGAVAVAPGSAGGGSMTVAGSVTSGGDITNNGGALGSLGTLQAKYNAHTHNEQGDGAPVSPPLQPVP